MKLRLTRGLAMAGALMALPLALAGSPAQAQTTATFSDAPTVTTAGAIHNDGITVTGSNDLEVDSYGLGVAGGDTALGATLIDNNESALFLFDSGPATDVSFTSNGGETPTTGNGSTFGIEGVGSSGQSLGTVDVNPINVVLDGQNVSSLFGDAPLEGFRLIGAANSGLDVATITYTPAAAPTPESTSAASLGLLLAAGLGAVALRRRKRQA